MRQELRSSLWAKLIASGFILLILMGNFWIIFLMTGQVIPVWLQAGFMANMSFLAVCCLGFVVSFLLRYLQKTYPGDNSEKLE